MASIQHKSQQSALDCVRCLRRVADDDVALECGTCRGLYHHDCFIPGAPCVQTNCKGTAEFKKSDPRCTKARCLREPCRLGWKWLGPGSGSLCHEHASEFRFNEGIGVLGAFLFVIIYFLLRAGPKRAMVILHNQIGFEVAIGIVTMFLVVAVGYFADARRIHNLDPHAA